MRNRLHALVLVVVAAAALSVVPAGAQQSRPATTTPGHTIAGGSDVPRDRIEIPQGGALDDVYHLYLANPTNEPFSAAFRSDAPQGMTVIPTQNEVKVAPNDHVDVGFTIRTSNNVPGGDYDITVSMVRNDIPEGGVPLIPAIAQVVRLRVGGVGVPVSVLSIDRITKQPVTGELVLERVRGASRVPVGRARGSQLDVNVVPGDYEAAFLLSGHEVTRKAVRVQAGGHPVIQLEVDAISFQSVGLTKIRNADGDLAAAQLDALIQNSLAELKNPSVKLRVRRDGKQVDDVLVQQLATLPMGQTKVGYQYIPRGGWKPGHYRLELRLENGAYTVPSSRVPEIDIPAGMPLWLKIALALLLLIILGVIARLLYRRRQRVLAAAGYPTRAERRDAARRAKEDGRQAREELKRAHKRAKQQPVGPEESATLVASAAAGSAIDLSPGRVSAPKRFGRRRSDRVVAPVAGVDPVLPPEVPSVSQAADAAMFAAYTQPFAGGAAQPTVAAPMETPLPSGPLPPGLPPTLPAVVPPPVDDVPMPAPPSNYGGVVPEPNAVAPTGITAVAPRETPAVDAEPLWKRNVRPYRRTSTPQQPRPPASSQRARWADDQEDGG